jgi:putative ABC transport system permease protein
MHDIRLAIRALLRTPVVSAVAIVSLTLGIGANAAVFSILNAVLLKPLPYPDAHRLVLLGYTFSGASGSLVSETKLNVWKEHADALQDVAALRVRRVSLADGADADQVLALQANVDLLTLIGARAALGRVFTADEDRPAGDRVVILADGFWKRRFGADPRVVGRQLRLDGEMTTVVGVLNPNVDTAVFNATPDVWIPLQLDANSTSHPPSLIAAARLRPGATLAGAQAEARVLGEAFHRRFPDASGPNDTFTVVPFQNAMVQNVRASLLVLAGAMVFVLLIACANVANLMLIRGSVRQRETAIRTAIGASRWRIVRQLTTESLMLVIVGGSLGLAFGTASIRMLLALNPSDLPRLGPDAGGVTADWRVLMFTVTISVITGLVCGVWPALRLSQADHLAHLAGTRSSATPRDRRIRAIFVVGEMALALVLLIGASLLIRTFVALNTVDRGYDARRVVTLRVALADPRFAKTVEVERFVRIAVQRVTALPGVVGVAATRTLPLESDWQTNVRIVDRPFDATSPVFVSYRIISPEYFGVLNVPVLRGRGLSNADRLGATPVAIINEAMARRFWPTGDALRDRIIVFPGVVPDDEPVRQVVGIVGNVRDGMPLERDDRPIVYVPLAQLLDRESAAQASEALAWIIRGRGESGGLMRTVEREITQASGNQAIADVRSLDQLAARAIAPTTFSMTVLIVFGTCAVLLAGIGLYGVIAYTVQQRADEIAVRLAIGARWYNIRNMVLLDGLKLASCGVAVGIPAAAALVGTLTAFLFGVVPHDLVTFAIAPLFLCLVAFGAVWLPARRASRIDPAAVFRRS